MIEVVDVCKSFKDVDVLENANGIFEQGIIYCLTGRNGTGKSVLLKLICELIAPDQGFIRLPEKHRFGVMIDNPRFWRDMTGLETLRYLASIRKEIDDDVIKRYMKEFGLWTYRNKPVGSYSLGMKQKLAIIQAFMEDPDILLLDEPTNALDDNSVEVFRSLLKQERDMGKYIIVTTHNIADMEMITDQFIRLENRRLIFE